MRFVRGREDDGLIARHEVPCNRAPKVADADDCGCQRASFPSSSSESDASPGDPPVAYVNSLHCFGKREVQRVPQLRAGGNAELGEEPIEV